jgi:hypothetical protein
MKTVLVTDQNQTWFEIQDATVLTARRYLAEPESVTEGAVWVLNLCRTGRYQGRGYYVSPLAEARGQRPLPDVKTIGELKSEAYVRALDDEIQPLVHGVAIGEGITLAKDPATCRPTFARPRVWPSKRESSAAIMAST